ncbi:hypothetical protein E8E14_012030 [Neopestalotiopsis sp. 37M]|nr:hypothetical protein E8E14_012030 [Neopestalotiopsis sp. 37M]
MASSGATTTTSTAVAAPSTSSTTVATTTKSATSTPGTTGTKATAKKSKKQVTIPIPPAVLWMRDNLLVPIGAVIQHQASWVERNLWSPTEHFVRTEASHQEYLVKSVYNRQPRHVGHFLFRLIHSLSWIPRYLFELGAHLLNVATTILVQLVDLAFALTFRALSAFPWASSLFFGLVAALPTIPYDFWVHKDDARSAVLSGVLVAAWFLWMSHLYLNKPQRWLGYTRMEFFPWLSVADLLYGPYIPLAVGVWAFVRFRKDLLTLGDLHTIHVEKQPIYFVRTPPGQEEIRMYGKVVDL